MNGSLRNAAGEGSRDLPIAGLFHLGVIYLVWGSTYLAIRIAVRDGAGFEPFLLGLLRVAPASIVLLLLSRLRGNRILPERGEWKTLVLSGLLMWIGGNGVVNWAEQHVDSGYTALIVGAMPLWTAALEAALDRRLPSWRLALGLLIGFAGLVVLVWPVIRHQGGPDALAAIGLVFGAASWGGGSVLMARRPVKLGPLATSGWQQLLAIGGFALLALLFRERMAMPTPAAIGAYVYLVVFGSIIAFTSFMVVLKLLPTSLVFTYAYVNPVVAVFLGWLMLRESVTWYTISGAALVLFGVAGVFQDRKHRLKQLRSASGKVNELPPRPSGGITVK